MKRTTVKIPDDLDAWLRSEAKRRGVTVSELVRDAILQYRSPRPRKLLAAAAGGSGQSDISERIEELIAAEWGPE